jgi:L-iditol 2-dehydrogenase
VKAIQMMGINDLRVADVPTPSPAADEVLVKIMAVGICGSDIPRILEFGAHVTPIIPGHEFAGQIEQVGADVRGFRVGQKVSAAPLIPCNTCEWCAQGIYSLCENYKYYGSRNNGAFAQYLAVKAANLIQLSEDTPYEWGATLDPAANALHAAFRASLTRNDSVCVIGLGAIGLFALQYAKVLGCEKITAVDIDDSKLAVAVSCGATQTVNSLKEDKKDLEKILPKGADVVMEMSGAPAAQHQSILAAGKMGRVVFLGISHAGLTLSEKAVDRIERYQLSIIGSWNSFSDPFPGREWTEAAALMGEKKLSPDLVISHRLPLEECPAVFDQIHNKTIKFNKILFLPNGE